MIAAAGTNGERWRKLIRLLTNVPQEEYSEIIEHLSRLAETKLDLNDQLTIRGSLRSILARHRSFPERKVGFTEREARRTRRTIRSVHAE